MNKVRQIQRLNKLELEQGVSPSASWHRDHRHTAYVYFGGLPYDLTEGDVITIFSQFGEPTFVKLARDKVTGKSRGFGWLKYEDQRSCDLAVDNLAGATVLNRVLVVDHTDYKEHDDDENEDEAKGGAKTEPDPDQEYGSRCNRRDSSGSEQERTRRKQLPEEMELLRFTAEHDDEDPMKAYLIDEKKKEVQEAIARQERAGDRRDGTEHRHRHRHHHDSDRRRHRDRDDIDDSKHRRRREADEKEDRRRSRSGERNGRDRQKRSRQETRHRSSSPDSYRGRSERDRRHRSPSSSDDGGRRRRARRERSSDRRDRSADGRRRRM